MISRPATQLLSANLHYCDKTSFGVATVDFALTPEAITLEGLIASADGMLYSAKRGGRNQVRSLAAALKNAGLLLLATRSVGSYVSIGNNCDSLRDN